jgi:hypothetical protein
MANTITNLDFDDIKAGLKAFLQSQDDITDYDYEGSAISRVLDILSLNTHYNAFLANTSFNESFLQTAIKRANGVTRAGEHGYVARSAKSATAVVNVDIVDPTQTPINLSMDKYSAFQTTIDGTDYTFYTVDAINTPLVDGAYEFANVKIYEGKLLTNSYVYDGVSTPSFVIPNADVDLDTLTVTVQNSAIDTLLTKYNFTNTIQGITGTSPVYFVKENAQEQYEVYFGDGVIGAALAAGNVVKLTYLVSSKTAANVSAKMTQTFTFAGDIGGNTGVTVRTISNSVGGAEKEDLASIQFNAPLSLASGKRLITSDDYLVGISEGASSVDAVSVWGGEDNSPPVYGKVFICLKPFDGYVISDQVKTDITANILNKQGNRLITPVFVDPDYLYMTLNVVATYDPNLTSVGSDDIAGYISTTISDYFTQELSKFKKDFQFSRLSKLIDSTNDSIQSNIMNISLQKRQTFPYNYPTTIDFLFGMAVTPGSLKSNVFTYSVGDQFNVASMFVDDGAGNISVQDWTTLKILAPNIGSIDYTTGEVIVKDFVITGLMGNVENIIINVSPKNGVTDVDANKNQIIMLDDSTKNNTANIASGLTVAVVAKKQ